MNTNKCYYCGRFCTEDCLPIIEFNSSICDDCFYKRDPVGFKKRYNLTIDFDK